MAVVVAAPTKVEIVAVVVVVAAEVASSIAVVVVVVVAGTVVVVDVDPLVPLVAGGFHFVASFLQAKLSWILLKKKKGETLGA